MFIARGVILCSQFSLPFPIPNPVPLGSSRSCWASHQQEVSSNYSSENQLLMGSGSSRSNFQPKIPCTRSNTSGGTQAEATSLPLILPARADNSFTTGEVLPVKEATDLAANSLD